ncbi:MAG: hypothetical protein Q9160_004523 [Pyrenula sp. 1 TL-2023]
MASQPFTFPPPPPPPPRNGAPGFTQTSGSYASPTAYHRGRGYGPVQAQNSSQTRGYGGRGRGGDQHFQSRGGYGTDGRATSTYRAGYNVGRATFRGSHSLQGRGRQQPQHHGPDLNGTNDGYGMQQTFQQSNHVSPNSYSSPFAFPHSQAAGAPLSQYPVAANGCETKALPQGSYVNNQAAQVPQSSLQRHSSSAFTSTGKRPHSTAFSNPARSNPRPQAPPPVPNFGFNPLPAKPPAPSAESESPSGNKKKRPRKSNQLGLTPHSEDPEAGSEDDADEEQKLATNQGRGLQFTHRGRTCTLTNDKEIRTWLAERKRRFPTQERREAALKEAEERKQKWEEEKRKRNEERQARQAADKARREELNATRGKNNGRKKRSKGGRHDAEPAEGESKDASIESAQSQSPGLRNANLVPSNSRSDESHVSYRGVKSGVTANAALDAVTIAKQRAEKFRKKALKEEAKAREAEAKAFAIERDHNVHEQTDNSAKNQHPPNSTTAEVQSQVKEESNSESSRFSTFVDTALLTPTSPSNLRLSHVKDDPTGFDEEDNISLLSSSSDPSTTGSDSDLTSSSGSSATLKSEFESDSDSDHSTASGPESQPLHPINPIRVPPPPRQGHSTIFTPKKVKGPICFQFRNTGSCARGENCRFSHDLTQSTNQGRSRAQGKRNQDRATEPANKNRHQAKEKKSLYQVLVKKEKDDERQKMLEAICWLGERGMLNGPDEPGEQPVDRKLQKENNEEQEKDRNVTKTTTIGEEVDVANTRHLAEAGGQERQLQGKMEDQSLAADLMVAAAAATPL